MAKRNFIKSPQNAQTLNILRGVQNAYDNADLIGGERSAITGLHQLMLTNIDELGNRLKSASTDLLETMLGISILEFCDFNTVMGIYMDRLMQININERRITLNNLGADAHLYGNADNITPYALKPSYVQDMNYLDFIRQVRGDEPTGRQSTQRTYMGTQTTVSPDKFDYGNLYPDDLGQGDSRYFGTRSWNGLTNQNSLLYKTKRLFSGRKINSLISRFGTRADAASNDLVYNGAKRSEFGESHGRNLLKASAEYTGGTAKYMLNGYNNPYCRVWTHHYQYNQFYKTIRPFSKVSYSDTLGAEIVDERDTLRELHKWKGFEHEREDLSGGESDYGYGWKNGDAGWERSVLDLSKGGDGMLKIAPKYVNSRATNIHTKDCMFSIENLAWRGYDPYSFEKALSWEQRGPLGGRIMWFPPYGINFNETTSVNWSSNTFIGRGEDVYTYVNTVRSGTLSFLMVVDHPSIIDYASWYDESDAADEYRDTDLMRFFAGCDSLDSNDPRSIMSRVKPTPLTDEYLAQYVDDTEVPLDINEPPVKPPPPLPTKHEKVISFYVFYPNNYSGLFDVDADFSVAYLLAGVGCQKNGEEDMKVVDGHDFTFANLKDAFFSQETNPGYETTSRPVSRDSESGGTASEMMSKLDEKENFIYGFAKPYKNIPKSEKKRWYYRVDGEYKVPNEPEVKKGKPPVKNTYGQKIPAPDSLPDKYNLSVTPENTNYCDLQSFRLNSSTINWDDSLIKDADENHIYCTLTQMAQIVAYKKGLSEDVQNFFKNRTGEVNNDQKIELLKDIFDNYELKSVDAVGYSNSHQFNANANTNKSRNDVLALERGRTIINWLKKNEIIPSGMNPEPSTYPSTAVKEEDRFAHSGLSAKMWRSAKISLTFEMEEYENLSETDQPTEDDETTFQRYTGYNAFEEDGKTYYKDENGEIWVEKEVSENGKQGVLIRKDAGEMVGEVSNNMRGGSQGIGTEYAKYKKMLNNPNYSNSDEMIYGFPRQGDGSGEKNVYRYDQEYYFFRALKKKDPLVFSKLMDKIKYFDPAFHSMTPEGFNARLTFLNQCTRQGNTITMSDNGNLRTANNLAFGRPPFCVLRIGDFYNQMIVIDNINIDYNVSNGIQWDMNSEGIGMQPLLAQVNISFKFIGGGDLAGPVRRLQNAMSFNYYANTRLYDNRADRVTYESDGNDKEIGGANHHNLITDPGKSYAYITNTYKGK